MSSAETSSDGARLLAVPADSDSPNLEPTVSPKTSPPSQTTSENAPLSSASASPVFSPRRRTFILILVSAAMLVGPIGGSIYNPLIVTLQEALQCPDVEINATLTVYVLFQGFAPLLVWGPIGDIYGRRPVYLVSFLIFILASIASVFSVNVWMLFVCRLFTSFGASAVNTTGVGTIADVFPKEERSKALGWFYLGPMIGPFIGGPLGGLIASSLGWRYCFAFLAIIGAVLLVNVYFFLPETLPKNIVFKKKPNAFRSMHKLRHPFVSLVTFWVCILFSSNFAVSTQIARQYTRVYGFSEVQVGLVVLSTASGNIVGSLIGGWYADRSVRRGQSQNTEGGRLGPVRYVAEDRLRSTWVSAVSLPAGLLIYGWGIQSRLHFMVPIVGQFLLGYGMLSISTSANAYLVELWPAESASTMSVNNFWRYIAAAITPLFITSLEDTLGAGPLYSGYACLHLFGAAGVLWIVLRGTKVRMAREPWKSESEEGGKG
ncbi:MFS general substrate transporter [Gonapodya prolifera JEL478]|uniref:MFS general substrate transporter n=1 Tax=Gonapodya prolifera (strain JEL478) TaxID=1344416 RepID=A0A139AHD3_GONPJ|nr:MFS general substrate transporter [Gonapodya prolifera JEL478]|eukprot:KXS16232.1 MFS general substrate transporter [Gonapodya prolifera JEL478]